MTDKPDKGACRCPYCDGPVDPKPPFCEPCQKEFNTCRDCGKPIPKDSDCCPECNPNE